MPQRKAANDQHETCVSPPGDTLTAALARHEIELEEAAIGRLESYCRMLWDWNEKFNLTRHTDYEKFVARDVIDSLALARFLESGERVLDVGTGGGVPGVVLSIVRPDLRISLLESVGKKARAVGDMADRLKLGAPVHRAGIQEFFQRYPASYNTLVARAVARLDKLLRWLAPHWDQFERLLLIKGPRWTEERQTARAAGLLEDKQLRRLWSYPLVGAEGESVVLEIGPKLPREKQPK